MSTLKTHNLQSPDAGSVNIALAPNAGMVVAGLSTYSNQINVGSNIKVGNAGVITATSFVGSGAQLTGLPAGTTINSNTNNYLITGTGTANTLQGESNLTFDGNNLAMSGTGVFTLTRNSRTLTLEGNYGNEGHPAIKTSSGHDLRIMTSGNNEKLRIDSDGRLIVGGGTHAGGSALVVKGGNQNNYSTIGMFSNHTNPTNNTLLTQIRFGANTTAVGADVRVYADADWGSNDYPSRMEFHTTPDGSNSKQVRMKISKDGYITKPNHPMFEVTTNGGQNLTHNTVEKVIWNNVVSQRGVTFDTSNYRFTAPIAGYYHFDVFIYTYYTRFVECDFRVNGASTGTKNHRLITYVNSNDQNPCPIMGSWTQYLAKDDYMESFIQVYTSHGSHRYIYGDTNRKPTWWGGYLVG